MESQSERGFKYLYLIKGLGHGEGFWKVGASRDWEKRTKDVMRKAPFPSMVIKVAERDDAKELEKEFKKRNERYYSKGDWFNGIPAEEIRRTKRLRNNIKKTDPGAPS